MDMNSPTPRNVGDLLLRGADVPTFSSLSHPTNDNERIFFRQFRKYTQNIVKGSHVQESALQTAVGELYATLPELETPDVSLSVLNSTDLANTIESFTKYRVPALLVRWREEVKTVLSFKQSTKSPLAPVEEEEDVAIVPSSIGRSVTPSPAAPRSARKGLSTQSRKSSSGKRSSTKSKYKSKSDTSSRVGVRSPDFTIALEREGKRNLILLVSELKVYNVTAADRAGDMLPKWRMGMGQEILYLYQCFLYCGTRHGLFILRTSFSRLFADDLVMYLEIPATVIKTLANRIGVEETADSVTITVQQLFDCGDILAPSMPHNWLDSSGQYNRKAVIEFCAYLALPLTYLESLALEDIGDRLPDPPVKPVHALPTNTGLDFSGPDNVSTPPLPLDALLELAFQAHPDKYPRWWVDGKKELVARGMPDAQVPVSARPKSDKSGSTGDGGSAAGSASDGGAGGDMASDNGGAGSSGDGKRRSNHDYKGKGQDKSRQMTASVDLPTAPLCDDDDGLEHTRRWLEQQSSHSWAPSTPPRGHLDQDAQLRKLPSAPPDQKLDVLSTPPMPAGVGLTRTQHQCQPSALPTPETTPDKGRMQRPEEPMQLEQSQALYDSDEIGRTSAVVLQDSEDDSTVGSETAAERERERWLARDLARFTLAGWRVRLITPEAMTERLGC